MSILKEFKEFAVRGNVVDLAVGIIIGASFGKIITSLVNDLVLPPVSLLFGVINFSDIKILLKGAKMDASGAIITQAVTLNIGNFLQSCFDFMLAAFAIFLLVKIMNRMKRKEEMAPTVAPTKEETLLTEIRDLLKK